MIFGLKNNTKNENDSTNHAQNISNEDNDLVSKQNNTQPNISNESIGELKPEFEMIDDYNDYEEQTERQNSKEDELLQIPAFLRRQAN